MNKQKVKLWDRKFIVTLSVFFIFIALVFTLPFLFTNYSWFDLDFSDSGEIGDTIGGITAPFIAAAASVLTFIAFWVQYKANEQQRQDIQVERIESKYYELINLHKANVDEFFIGTGEDSVQKRKSFVSMFNEFKYTFYCCKGMRDALAKSEKLTKKYSDEKIVRLAYIFFYCGVGDNSDIMNKAMNSGKEFEDKLFNDTLDYLNQIKNKDIGIPEFTDEDGNKVSLTIKYLPWGGHQSRLGHYYRHLFQTTKFICKQEIEVMSKNDKLEYLRTLRAQLSDHEQLMLYYNAIAGFGYAWINDEKNDSINYFVDYKMIHNIPLPLANFGIRPEKKFEEELKKDPTLFEWQE